MKKILIVLAAAALLGAGCQSDRGSSYPSGMDNGSGTSGSRGAEDVRASRPAAVVPPARGDHTWGTSHAS